MQPQFKQLKPIITNDISNTATGFFQIASGTTAQRPTTPLDGMRRYNATTLRDEFYANGAWQNHVRLGGDTFTGTVTAPSIASDLVNAKQLATPVTTLTPTGTTQTINLALGSMFILDLSSATGDVTLTIQNLLAGTTYIIFARQGATRRNVIFPTAAAPNATVQNGARSNTYNTGVANIEDLITIASPNGTKIYLSVNNNFA